MAQIDDAIAYFEAEKEVSYNKAAKLYGVSASTLARRHQGKQGSRAAATSTHHQSLNDVQEDTLLRYIDRLTDRHMPPTTQVVKNLAEEIAGQPIGKNWTARFLRRHSKRICSPYLRALDNKRACAESVSMFKHFYQLVLLETRY